MRKDIIPVKERKVAAAKRRSAFAPVNNLFTRNLIGRALIRLFPWTIWTYPGTLKGVIETLGHGCTKQSVRNWIDGRTACPAWVAERIGETLEARAAGDLALAAQLKSYACEHAASERARKLGEIDRMNQIKRQKRKERGLAAPAPDLT